MMRNFSLAKSIIFAIARTIAIGVGDFRLLQDQPGIHGSGICQKPKNDRQISIFAGSDKKTDRVNR